MSRHYDAIIIGGGPAGSYAALRLRSLNWNVLLVERRNRNTAKTCGHCLNPRVFSLLNEMGVMDAARSIAVGHTKRVRVYHDDYEIAALLPNPNGEAGLLLPRDRFDQLLLDTAVDEGVDVRQPASAQILRRNADSCEIGVEGDHCTTPLVIGADGLRSRVAADSGMNVRASRTLRMRPTPARKYGFSFDIKAKGSRLASDTIHMFVRNAGYLGVVRQKDDVLHIGGCVTAGCDPFDFVQDIAGHFDKLRDESLAEIEKDQTHEFTAAGPMPCRPTKIANERVALVGDAAGYIEPFTGEGMSWAIESAAVLAGVLIDETPGSWNERLAARYRTHLAETVHRRMRWCRAAAYGLDRPRLRNVVLRAARRMPKVAAWTVRRAVSA